MLSTAENFLYMLKGNEYTPLEAELLDLCLVLHAEHGGGNNSTLQPGWSVPAVPTLTLPSLLPSDRLKGPLHGGANIQVVDMIADIKNHIKNWLNEEELADYLRRSSTRKHTTTPARSMVSDMQSIPFPTRGHCS